MNLKINIFSIKKYNNIIFFFLLFKLIILMGIILFIIETLFNFIMNLNKIYD